MSDHASVTSSDEISTGPSTRRGNVRFGNILSPFASSKNSKVLQRDQTIHELEAVICSNIEVIRRIKCAIEEIDTPVQGNTSNSTDNIAQLKDALLCLGSEGGWCASAEILTLQTKVKVLESQIFMQGVQQETLNKDLTQLNDRILDMEAQKSCQEDEIESLKARVVTLELSCRLKDDSIASLEEAMNTQSKCNDLTISNSKVECEKKVNEMKSHSAVQEDQIRLLRAEIRGLHDEKRNAMEEMKKDLELAALERE
jgi:chromosome segregation ATPase